MTSDGLSQLQLIWYVTAELFVQSRCSISLSPRVPAEIVVLLTKLCGVLLQIKLYIHTEAFDALGAFVRQLIQMCPTCHSELNQGVIPHWLPTHQPCDC